MNIVPAYDVPVAVSATSTTPVYIDKYDQLLIEIPAVASVFASGVVNITLQGAATSSSSNREMHYYDYVSQTPNTCVITVSTGGIYEMAYPGALNFISLAFDVAASQPTMFKILGPKTRL